MDSRIEKLADMMVNYSCKVKPGEHVMVTYSGAETLDMVTAVIEKIYAAGGSPYLVPKDNRLMREIILHANDEQLERMCRYEMALTEDVDCFISIRATHNEYEFSDIPVEKMQNYNKRYSMPLVWRRMQKDRWAGISYPCASEAQAMATSQRAYEDFFFRVCTMDYPKMYRACLPLKALMDRTDRVRIVGPGTDLCFAIRGIEAKICAGDHNIPDGECFTAPVRDSVNGQITYNIPNVVEGYCYDTIRFTFENGRIVDVDCSDPARLNKYLDVDEGARYLGEFAIGFNPAITQPMKKTLYDEKLAGSIHVTPGQSFEYAGNGNSSSIHCDLVLLQTPEYGGGEIWFDDVLIRKDGRFVLPELQALNPEELLKEDAQ